MAIRIEIHGPAGKLDRFCLSKASGDDLPFDWVSARIRELLEYAELLTITEIDADELIPEPTEQELRDAFDSCADANDGGCVGGDECADAHRCPHYQPRPAQEAAETIEDDRQPVV